MPDRPNILFIITDQQSASALGCAGNLWVQTPNLDALAARGIRFANSYCTSPVCSPSRASLVTGRMPHTTKVNFCDEPIAPTIPVLGELFRSAGYETAWAGKWHLPRSFADSSEVGGFRYLPLPKPGPWGGRTTPIDVHTVDQAVAFLQSRHRRPFLLTVSLEQPHDICHHIGSVADLMAHVPPETWPTDTIPPLPSNFAVSEDEPEFISDCRNRTTYGAEIRHTIGWGEREWRMYLFMYYQNVVHADHYAGQLLGALDDFGLTDDTLVVMTSDHGEGMAAHRWVVKLMLWEEAVRVPLIFAGLGLREPGRIDTQSLTSGVDILPTLCDFAGIMPPQEVDGQSLRPALENSNAVVRERDFAVAELHPFMNDLSRGGRMLRSQQYKYVAFSDGARPEQLFDLQCDPGEICNLAYEPLTREVLLQHRELLARWLQETGDGFRMASLVQE